MVPFNMLSKTLKFLKSLKFSKPAGIGPTSALLLRVKDSSFTNLDIPSGIPPVKELPSKSRKSKPLSFSIFSGMFPEKLLSFMMRYFNFFNKVIDSGMLPSKLLSPIHSSVNKENLEILSGTAPENSLKLARRIVSVSANSKKLSVNGLPEKPFFSISRKVSGNFPSPAGREPVNLFSNKSSHASVLMLVTSFGRNPSKLLSAVQYHNKLCQKKCGEGRR